MSILRLITVRTRTAPVRFGPGGGFVGVLLSALAVAALVLVSAGAAGAKNTDDKTGGAGGGKAESTATLGGSLFSSRPAEFSEVRDRIVVSLPFGMRLINSYYKFSPFACLALQSEEKDPSSQIGWLVNLGVKLDSFILHTPAFTLLYVALLLFPVFAGVFKLILCRRRPASSGQAGPGSGGGAADAPGTGSGRRHETVTVIVWLLTLLTAGTAVFLAGSRSDAALKRPIPANLTAEKALSPELVRRCGLTRALSGAELNYCMDNADADVRYEGTYAAVRILKLEFVPAFIRGLKDPDIRVRRWAATGLATLRSRAAFDALLTLLNDPEPMARYKGALALGKLGDRAAIDHLTALLKRTDEFLWVRLFAFRAIEQLISQKR
ncbi:MAG: HEAT repeat domain-containing protein [Planctomycetota bacterium]|nr:HEAT repeat domain-containing protein [Planctomycetota bacterium]